MYRGERALWPHRVHLQHHGPHQAPKSKGKDISPASPHQKLPWISAGERGERSESSSFGYLQIPSAWPGCSPSLPGHEAGNPSGNPPGDPAKLSPPLPLCTQGIVQSFVFSEQQQNSWSLQRYFPLLFLRLGVIHHTCCPFFPTEILCMG